MGGVASLSYSACHMVVVSMSLFLQSISCIIGYRSLRLKVMSCDVGHHGSHFFYSPYHLRLFIVTDHSLLILYARLYGDVYHVSLLL